MYIKKILSSCKEYYLRFKNLGFETKNTLIQTVGITVQAVAVILSLSMIYYQVNSDLDRRKVESTIQTFISSSRDYRKIDFVNARKDIIPDDRVKYLLCHDEQMRGLGRNYEDLAHGEEILSARNMFAELEWQAVGVRQGALSYETVDMLRGGYLVAIFNRWQPFIQARIDMIKDPKRKEKLYEHFEWLVRKLAAEKWRDKKVKELVRTKREGGFSCD